MMCDTLNSTKGIKHNWFIKKQFKFNITEFKCPFIEFYKFNVQAV